jgi:hypothetical protein
MKCTEMMRKMQENKCKYIILFSFNDDKVTKFPEGEMSSLNAFL